ncbi:7601_t:CDS:2 [Scutellospora calospora]|uniref:7601_t:CDS:1 n=1 Tax=Scutellospora calospora TaxID=85575 RepID=A0ACA9L4J4_9GLOM|nr:7601_t:CDS:2 [Scutellospora calospora]
MYSLFNFNTLLGLGNRRLAKTVFSGTLKNFSSTKVFNIKSLPRVFNNPNEKSNLVYQSFIRPSILPYFGKVSLNAFDNSIRLKTVYKYKMKSHSGTKKRWRVTGRGKFKRARPGKAHLNTGVSRAHLLRLRKTAYSHRTQRDQLKKLLPYAF